MAHIEHSQENILARVRRIAGQVAAIDKAVSTGADCAAVLHQVAGVRGAVLGLMDELIDDHIREHLAKPGLSDDERAAAASELATIIRRYGK